MGKFDIERRKYPRYDTELKVYFQVKYDIKTRVEFEVVESIHPDDVAHKYSGLCNNVSAEGLCFASKKRLEKGDILLIEVYEPAVKNPVRMEGHVRWSERLPGDDEKEGVFHTGVQLISVGNKLVSDSVYFDKKYKVMWSAVLESLFGTFAAIKK